MSALAAELTDGGADWQLHAYGGAGHGFTDASMKGSARPGFGYDETADRWSWAAMTQFFEDVFG